MPARINAPKPPTRSRVGGTGSPVTKIKIGSRSGAAMLRFSIARRLSLALMYGRHVIRIRAAAACAWNVEMLEPFGIAQGAQLVARNALAELELESGARGLGEAAPFPAVNGETQAQALAALERGLPELVGRELADLE